jgi:hypothetical protein
MMRTHRHGSGALALDRLKHQGRTDSLIQRLREVIPAWSGDADSEISGGSIRVIEPDVLHADMQGQSEPVFALAPLLGIELMPRIRNWKSLDMYRPDHNSHYDRINSLFTE